MSTNGDEYSLAEGAALEPAVLDVEAAGAAPLQLSRIPARRPAGRAEREALLARASPPRLKHAYRELRFALEASRVRSGVRTLGLASLDPGDGRSVIAANLAFSFTEGGRRKVVLVDASFERPSVARMLDAEAPAGLAEVMAGRIPLEAALFASGRPGLFALSAGNPAAAGLEPLDALDTFGAIADRLATVFDFVIVDTPALHERVDAAAFVSRLDGALFVVRARRTRAAPLEAGLARLGEGKVLGLVLNDVPKE